MQIIKGQIMEFDSESKGFKDVHFINCKISYFLPNIKTENCVFEDCEFKQNRGGYFSPNFMENCEINNCLFEENRIIKAYVKNGQNIQYLGQTNDLISTINSQKPHEKTLANAKNFLIDEGYDGMRGGLSIIFQIDQHPEIPIDMHMCYYLLDEGIGVCKIPLLTNPKVDSEGIHYLFDGEFCEITTEIYKENEEKYEWTPISESEILDLNENAKECYRQTIAILNGTIGKDLEWNLTFDGYMIDAEHFVSMWAYDSETNVIYQKCQMAYPT